MTMTMTRVVPLFLALVLASSHHTVLSFVTSSLPTDNIIARSAADSSSPPVVLVDASSLAGAPDDDNNGIGNQADDALLSSTPLQLLERHTKLLSCQRRRDILTSLFSTTILGAATLPAYASLLEDYGADLNVNKQTDKTITTTTTATKKTKELARDKGKIESSMEPNLRSNYYYPTNKVRYLPRIKKCSDAIPSVALAIGNEDWDSVRDFATVVADDTILPMKLYVSSLSGGGTNVKVGFAKDMMASAKSFEKQQSLLVKSVEKRDVAKASSALEGMAEAMLAYRTVGRLLGPDGGGDIPSVDEIRRSTKRFRGEAFEAKVKERDARIKAAAETGSDST